MQTLCQRLRIKNFGTQVTKTQVAPSEVESYDILSLIFCLWLRRDWQKAGEGCKGNISSHEAYSVSPMDEQVSLQVFLIFNVKYSCLLRMNVCLSMQVGMAGLSRNEIAD
jgi:hypothetical protein